MPRAGVVETSGTAMPDRLQCHTLRRSHGWCRQCCSLLGRPWLGPTAALVLLAPGTHWHRGILSRVCFNGTVEGCQLPKGANLCGPTRKRPNRHWDTSKRTEKSCVLEQTPGLDTPQPDLRQVYQNVGGRSDVQASLQRYAFQFWLREIGRPATQVKILHDAMTPG